MHDENPTHAAPHSTTTQARHAAPSAVAGRDNRRRPHAKRKHQQKNARKPKGASRSPHRSTQKMHPLPRSASDQTSSRHRRTKKQARRNKRRDRAPQAPAAPIGKREGQAAKGSPFGKWRAPMPHREQGAAGLRPLVPLEARAKRRASQPQVARDQAQRASGLYAAPSRMQGARSGARSVRERQSASADDKRRGPRRSENGGAQSRAQVAEDRARGLRPPSTGRSAAGRPHPNQRVPPPPRAIAASEILRLRSPRGLASLRMTRGQAPAGRRR